MATPIAQRSRHIRWLAPLLVLVLLLAGCNQGMPDKQSGEFQLKAQSLTWDGDQYAFAWVDQAGAVHQARGDDVQLVQDTRTYLEMRDGRPIVHLTSDEPVTVLGRDDGGDFSSAWFPFMLGTMVGGRDPTVVVNQPAPGTSQTAPEKPAYRYPPTSSFGRGDTIQGSISNNRPSAPDYGRIKPIPDAVSGQSGGTGGGTAASGKSSSVTSGQAGGAGAGAAASTKGDAVTSGQAGGTGSGSAASGKGTFRSSGSSSSGPSRIQSGGKAPSVSAPSTGGKSSGGFSGGKSSGGFSGGKSSGGRVGKR